MIDISSIPADQLEEFINSGGLVRHEEELSKKVSDKVAETSATTTQPTSSVQSSLSQSIPVTSNSASKMAEQRDQTTLVPQRTEGFDFRDPVELLFLLDDSIASGEVKLHDWQIRFMLDFAREDHTKDSPFQAEVQAANGSGKDKYIVAACIVWLCMRYIQARGIATNGSGVQLDNQTEVYIRQLCERANSKIAPGIWKCNYRYYECLATGSPITLFATDEANKAEGYHPLVAGAKMAIFASEAKTIPDEIFTALERCTGYTHRVDVSTPGLPMGYFYDTCSTALNRKSVEDIKSLSSTQFLLYHVTAYDCSHISQSEIDRIESKLPGGKNNSVFKSSILAEFGTTDEMVVIPYTYVWRAYNSVGRDGHITEAYNKAGLDLSDGGDETVLVVRNGNKLLKVLPFKFDNTEDTIAYLNEKFKEYELTNPSAYIYADCGGLGKPMLDRMRRQGWSNIRYFDNRNTAYEPRTYKNRGSESWFHIRKLLERHELILYHDKELIRQLSTRYYKITTSNVHQLLSKLESRSRGYPSPDRADALVLAFCDYKSTWRETGGEENKPFKQPDPPKVVPDLTLKELAGREREQGFLWNRNPSRGKDFSLLREDIELNNKRILANKITI